MTDWSLMLLELVSAIGFTLLLIALSLLALVWLAGVIGAAIEHGGDRWALASRYVATGVAALATWLRSGIGVLDLLAAALTGQSPAHYVERRRQRAVASRQTGLVAAYTQTDAPSVRHNDSAISDEREEMMTTDARSVGASMRAAAAQAAQRGVDAAQRGVDDLRIARTLRAYRSADALVEALFLAGWGVGHIRAVVRVDNNRVSQIAGRLRSERSERGATEEDHTESEQAVEDRSTRSAGRNSEVNDQGLE